MSNVPRRAVNRERLFRRDDGRVCQLSYAPGPNAPKPSVQEFDDRTQADDSREFIFTKCEEVTFSARELKTRKGRIATCLTCLARL